MNQITKGNKKKSRNIIPTLYIFFPNGNILFTQQQV